MEDLPSGVVKQWARWGRHPDYMCSDPRLRPLYASYAVPLICLSFSDDELSTRKGFEDYLNLLGTRSDCVKEHYHLQLVRGRRSIIGHNGFFLDSNKDLWESVLPWILHAKSPVSQSLFTAGLARL